MGEHSNQCEPGCDQFRIRGNCLDEHYSQRLEMKPLSATDHEIEHFIREFEACSLPKHRWTHHAHLVVGIWYLTHHAPDDALCIVRQRIRAYNESVGTANTNSSGYHETLTHFYLHSITAHIQAHSKESLKDQIALLLQSPLADKSWPLSFYSHGRLFSEAARHGWLEPDLSPIPNDRNA
jgi:hypothetical protein